MTTIHKYVLDVKDEVTIDLPLGAKVLSVQAQNDKPCLWCMVEPDAPKKSRTFLVYGTGHPIRDGASGYIGTVQLHGGSLVFHVFEAWS